MVEEFKKKAFRGEATDVDHHELLSKFQVTFFIVEVNYCLFVFDTKDIMSANVSTVKGIIDLGQQQYTDLVNKVFLKEETIRIYRS